MKYFVTFLIVFLLCNSQVYGNELANEVNSLDLDLEPSSVFIPNQQKTLKLSRLSNEIIVDGVIDTLWNKGAIFENFTEYQPNEDRQPQVLTKGYITYDEKNLYVAFVCKDPDIKKLRASITDRDNIYDDDWISISIDPNKDHQMAYEFYVNAHGIQGDQLWQANGNEDASYDMVWYSEAKIFNDYWTTEMQIPFESLRFPKNDIQNWSVHITRQYPRENIYRYSWMPVSLNNNSWMSQAGNLQFEMPRDNLDTRTLEILPYGISTQQSFKNENGTDPKFGKWNNGNPDSRVGFGIKYGFSSNFIADLTYNPDFSQIEADGGQITVNNPFALFFNERRPFFQEGNEIYTVDRATTGAALDQFVNLFYSRSINNPLVAGKISGKMGKLSVGVTSAYDQNTPLLIPLEENSIVRATKKKSYNTIFRAKYDLGNQSSIGFFTSDRHFIDSGFNSVAAFDASIRLSEKYTASGIVALTHTEETDDPELSAGIYDADFVVNDKVKTNDLDGESFNGTLLRGKFQRDSRNWVSTLAYQDFSPGFRADNGFIQTNNYRNIDIANTYSFRYEDNPVFNFIRPQVTMWRKFNYDGEIKDTGIRANLAISFKNQTFVTLSSFLFNRENLAGKQFGDARSGWIFVQNNTIKSLGVNFFMQIGKQINRFGQEGDPNNPFEILPTLNYNVGFTLKPVDRLTNDISYREFILWKEYGKDKIVGQSIFRNSFTYQFNKNMCIRLIGEYNITDYFSAVLGKRVNDKHFTLDPMFSYKLNAFSVFYLGGHFGGNNNLIFNRENMELTGSTAYVKFQYLLRT